MVFDEKFLKDTKAKLAESSADFKAKRLYGNSVQRIPGVLAASQRKRVALKFNSK